LRGVFKRCRMTPAVLKMKSCSDVKDEPGTSHRPPQPCDPLRWLAVWSNRVHGQSRCIACHCQSGGPTNQHLAVHQSLFPQARSIDFEKSGKSVLNWTTIANSSHFNH